MIGKVRIANPDEAILEITLTAPVGDWRYLLAQLDDGQWPSSDLFRTVREAISRTVDRVDTVHEGC